MSGGIGILGGTFNPIHLSHLYLAEEAKRTQNLKQVLFIPTYIPPHKQTKDLASAKDRIAMVNLALENHEGFSLCDYEVQRQGVSYTADTLKYLREEYPVGELWLIMGADMFLSLKEWRTPEAIFRLAGICAAARDEGELGRIQAYRPSLEEMGARCHILEIPPKPLSSTLIRELAAQGEDMSPWLPAAVWEYIRAHKLYGVGGDAS